jgi:ribosomal protein L40E
MSIIKNVSESFKKSPAKVITISLLVLVGLIYSWHITVPVVVVVYLWKKFKRDDEKKKDTKIKCRHCKTEIPWDATRCPSCHGKLHVFGFGRCDVVVLHPLPSKKWAVPHEPDKECGKHGKRNSNDVRLVVLRTNRVRLAGLILP